MVTLQKRLLVVVLALSPLVAQERIITSTELKANANGSSCWIQIDNYVYDITPYLSEHATTHEYALVKMVRQRCYKRMERQRREEQIAFPQGGHPPSQVPHWGNEMSTVSQ